MDDLQVSFQIYGDDIEKHKIVPYDLSFGEALEEAQFILGAPNGSYQLFLGRNKEALNPLATFQSSKIRPNEKLVLVAHNQLESWRNILPIQTHSVEVNTSADPAPKGKLYALFLTLSGGEVQQWKYSILLTRFYEEHPHQFFTDDDDREHEKLKESLSQAIPRPVKTFEVDRIIRLWCEDIAQGYPSISLKL